LNGTGTAGHSLVNGAILNGTTGGAGKVVNIAVLNGYHGHGSGGTTLPGGFRIINGVPCLPNGTPLTGAAAIAVMAALTPSTTGGNPGGPGSGGSTNPPSSGGSTNPPSGGGSTTPPGSPGAAGPRERGDHDLPAIGPGSHAGPSVRYLPRHS
jgi:hypothetical protein